MLLEKNDYGNPLEPDKIWIRDQDEIYIKWQHLLKTECDLLRNCWQNIVEKANNIVEQSRKNQVDADNEIVLIQNQRKIIELQAKGDIEDRCSQNEN